MGEAEPDIHVDLECDPCVNFALQQNHVAFLKRVRITNRGPHAVEDVRVRIAMDPHLADPLELRVDSIAGGGSHAFDVIDLPLSAERLVRQTEREVGALRVEVATGETVVAKVHRPVDVLAYNEWPGTRVLPEILAAFVLPNHPILEPILRNASSILLETTGEGSLSGYQSGTPERVASMVGAIYAACASLDLAYISPPASFESSGQKVRTPDQILATRLGTCLDLTLLFAAALEQSGLHPLLLLPKGHALVGVWLNEEAFPQPTLDDVTLVRKRVELGQILVFETTSVTARPVPRFEDAIRAGKRHLQDGASFHMAVDVRAARQAHIRPISTRVDGVAQPLAPTPPMHVPGAAEAAVAFGATPGVAPRDTAAPKKESGPARLETWKRRLLDLSLRNRLLNHRDGKTTIPILCPGLGRLEDKLAEGVAFDIHPKPEALGDADPRSPSLFADPMEGDLRTTLLRSALDSRRLHASLPAEELENRLTQLYRASKESLEEGGANTLFLALGFLRWFETKSSTQARLAPILLLPLQLERRTVVEGFKLKLTDDDAVFNVTLLQKLVADYGLDVTGLDTLDEDETGLDVEKILIRIRRAVLKMDRWEVVNDASIGLFSFTKYLMWRDLDRRTSILLKHPVVRHLIETPDRPFAPGTNFPDVARLDADREPTKTFCPLDADSSQLRAIYAAADGATYVLEGPPGTGKSQTITNLIANAVASGQKVLFVSEKMAALNVVRKRLAQVGLGPYCLELHSNKAQKRAVMDQLKASVNAAVPVSTGDWAASGGKLQALRGDLNQYADALHRRRTTGMSAHEGIGRLVELRDAASIPLSYGSPDAVSAERLAQLRERVHTLQLAGIEVGDVARSPWSSTNLTAWEPALPEAIRQASTQLQEKTREVNAAANNLASALGVPGSALSAEGLRALGEAGTFLASSPGPATALLTATDRGTARLRTEEFLRVAAAHRELAATVRSTWHDDAPRLDLETLSRGLRTANASVAPLAWWRARTVRKSLSGVWTGGGPLPSRLDLPEHLDRLMELRSSEARLQSIDPEGRALLEHAWRGLETHEGTIRSWLDWTEAFDRLVARTAGSDLEGLRRLREHWIQLVTSEPTPLAPEGPIGSTLSTLVRAVESLQMSLRRATDLVRASPDAVSGDRAAPGYLCRLQTTCERWVASLSDLRTWCAWRRARDHAAEAGLEPVITAIESGRVPPADVERAFDRSFLEWWVNSLFRADSNLGEFSRTAHEDKIRRFRNLDLQVIETAHEVVASKLSARMPRGTVELSSKSSSEMGMLQRELNRQRGHAPLRKLFAKIPTVLTLLKPCFLMSPLSVAQYLDVEFPAFDVVVFDEASQIPVWDAIGAIARGTRLIVVGDSRQLPPTNFFGRTDDEEVTDETAVQDLESILDECRAAQIPPLELKWHYRSRHESLIAFSNKSYYDNALLTFPSAQLASDTLGVVWRHVPNGVYDRGQSRANRAEAEAIVGHVVQHLTDPTRSAKSLGIVTFSVAQQILVEDLLDEARRKHPEIEPHFGAEREEPVFVKNLENVQGDERDVILFSICYGPDQQRHVAMNFGPLNRDGGERRLNVAITRAREALVVFSSLRADQIDLARSRAVGVRHLKDFLDYAERGPVALGAGLGVDVDAECESPFEEDVRRALEGLGWEVHPQVGCSGYRVDLGVKDPTAPGRFLLGVECDGAMYHSGKTARDRDRLRQAVLESLGWRIHRIWSTDWWQAREAELGRLHRKLQELKAARVASIDSTSTPATVVPKSDLFAKADHIVRAATTAPMPPRSTRLSGSLDYVPARVPPPTRSASGPEAFYDPRSQSVIWGQIEAVLATEAPIEEGLLAERVASSWGLQRMTPRVVDHLRTLLKSTRSTRSEDGQRRFLWRQEQNPAQHLGFRLPPAGSGAPRESDRIPVEEIANAAAAVLRDQVRMDRQSLARELGRVFGFARMGVRVESAMTEGIHRLIQTGRVVVNGEHLSLPA